MIKVKSPFLGLGKWRFKELLCDVCHAQIDPKLEYFGKIEFSEEYGPRYPRTHCHVECASLMSHEQLIENHEREFRNGLTLPKWEPYSELEILFSPQCRDEEFRRLSNFEQDNTGLLRRIVECTECRSIAVVTIPSDVSDPKLKVDYYHAETSEPHSVPSVCASSLRRYPNGMEIVSIKDCFHEFVRLFQSGDPNPDWLAVHDTTERRVAAMNKYDRQLLAMSRMGIDDMYRADQETAEGYTWYWCKICGYVARVTNCPPKNPPIRGACDWSISGQYHSLGVTQSRVAGAPSCRVKD